jgi:hypothetical protein
MFKVPTKVELEPSKELLESFKELPNTQLDQSTLLDKLTLPDKPTLLEDQELEEKTSTDNPKLAVMSLEAVESDNDLFEMFHYFSPFLFL